MSRVLSRLNSNMSGGGRGNASLVAFENGSSAIKEIMNRESVIRKNSSCQTQPSTVQYAYNAKTKYNTVVKKATN